jgi:hypothetical protein
MHSPAKASETSTDRQRKVASNAKPCLLDQRIAGHSTLSYPPFQYFQIFGQLRTFSARLGHNSTRDLIGEPSRINVLDNNLVGLCNLPVDHGSQKPARQSAASRRKAGR